MARDNARANLGAYKPVRNPTDRPASVSLEDWRFDTEGSLTHALCGSVYEVPPCSLTRLLALTEQHVCPEGQVIDGDHS